MKNNFFEIVVGTFVLICAIYFFVFSFKRSDLSVSNGYQLYAQFDNIDGINSGSDVRISGVKVGSVESQILDPITYRAKIKLNLESKIQLPSDSSAKIVSSGLLGEKYLAIDPGAEEEIIANGGEIKFTQSAVNFEELLGKFIFGSKTNETKAE